MLGYIHRREIKGEVPPGACVHTLRAGTAERDQIKYPARDSLVLHRDFDAAIGRPPVVTDEGGIANG